MRNTKKKKIKILLSIVILIILCSFGIFAYNKNIKNNLDNDNINNEKQKNESVEDIIGGSILDENKSGIIESGEGSENLSTNVGLYSNENRAVFNFGNLYYLVYDFKDEEVIGLSYYYTYEDERAAQSSYNSFKNALKNNQLSEIKDVKKDGKYIILVVKEEEYSNMTKETVMEAYSYLELIYDNSDNN